MASLGTITYKGASGKEYTFNIYDFNSSWNEVPAIYFVTHAFNSGSQIMHKAIYIGQTDNLKQRFLNHHKQACFSSHNANRLCIIIEKSENARLATETDLIRAIKPPCNDTI